MKKKKKIIHDEDDEEYSMFDEKGRLCEWFVEGLSDWLQGYELDLGRAIGKRIDAAKRAGTMAPPLKRSHEH